MEGFRRFIDRKRPESLEGEKSQIPIINQTLKECAKFDEDAKTLESVQDFLEKYFEEAIANTRLYSSEKLGASFPYTVVRLRDVAQAMHAKFSAHIESATQGEARTADSKSLSKKEIIFGTFFDVRAGHPYHWIERGIDDMSKRLPEALGRVSRGEEPEDFEVYGVGSPAGELGIVSEDFVRATGDHPFEHFGELYAEFVDSLKHTGSDKSPAAIQLWGVSMGASLAATTAMRLIEQGRATQSREEASQKSLPVVNVTMQMPVGAERRRWQIPAGFVSEFAIQKLWGPEYNNAVAAAERDFTESIYQKLRERGIRPHMTDQDIKAKKTLVSKSIDQLRNGIPIPENLKTNEIIGIYDPLMYSLSFQSEAAREGEEKKGSLQEHMVEAPSENRRQFAIAMTHTPAVVRENYFKRIIRAGESVRALRGEPLRDSN